MDRVIRTGMVNSRGIIVAFAAVLMALCLAASLGVQSAWALNRGDTFKKDGNTYKVTDKDDDGDDYDEVMLVKYGSSNKKPVINRVKYKGVTYEVEAIGKNAFNNSKGHKITSLTLGDDVDKVKAKAFYGCSKLKTINLRKADIVDIERENGRYEIDDIDIGSKAFAKAGISGVTVKCGSQNASYQALYKQALVKKGLRSDAKIIK